MYTKTFWYLKQKWPENTFYP